MHSLLESKLLEVKEILKRKQVKRAYAFGSVCTESFNDESDIDILISFEEKLDPITYGENYFKIIEELESLLGRTVDLVTERTLRNPYLLKSINSSKLVIYE